MEEERRVRDGETAVAEAGAQVAEAEGRRQGSPKFLLLKLLHIPWLQRASTHVNQP